MTYICDKLQKWVKIQMVKLKSMKSVKSLQSKNRFKVRPKKFDFLNWIFDREKRSAVTWLCTLVGGVFIAGYYLSLGEGFTPMVDFGQAALLLFLAFFIGTALVFAFCLCMFSPALAYRIIGIHVNDLPKNQLLAARKALMIRNLVTQFFFATALLAAIYAGGDAMDNIWTVSIATAIAAICAVVLVFLTRFTKYNMSEPRWQYYGSVILIGFFTILAISILYLLVRNVDKIETWEIFLAWFMLALYTVIISVLGKGQELFAGLLVLTSFFAVLNFLGVKSIMFESTAYAIGIAEKNPVRLIFPSTSCAVVRRALHPSTPMICEGEQAGVLNDVKLLNSLGERWLIRVREPNRLTHVTFDGSGVVIRKNISALPKNNSK